MIASATDYKNVKSGEGNQDPTLPPLESLKAKATRNRHRRRERMELLIGLKCHQLAWKKQCITGFTTYPLNRGFDLGQKHVHVKFIIIGSHSFRKQKKKKKRKLHCRRRASSVSMVTCSGWDLACLAVFFWSSRLSAYRASSRLPANCWAFENVVFV